MTAKWTSKKGKSTGRSNFQKLVNVLKNRARTMTGDMAKKYYNSFRITHDAYQKWYDSLPKATEGLDDLNQKLEELATMENATFNTYSTVLKKWNETYKGNPEYHPHHKEYSNVATQMRLIYEALLQMQGEMQSIWGNQKRPRMKYDKERGITTYTGTGTNEDLKNKYDVLKVIEFGEGKGRQDLTKTIEKFRELYIVALAISRETSKSTAMTVTELNDLLVGFTKMDQKDWEVIKDKHISVINKADPMEIEIIPKGINEAIAHWERRVGRTAQSIIGDFDDAWAKQVQSAMKDVDFKNLKGGRKTISDSVGEQIGDILEGKTPKPYKSKSKKKYRTKTSQLPKKIQTAKTLALKSTLTAKGKKTIEKGNTDDASLMSKLKTQINRRLPAEVRRNMTRPALENQSGQFSNSVELLNIRRSATGLTGDYTYTKSGGGTGGKPRTNVYSTFENYGRWGTDQYDPRKLITKSIRNLAEQYTKERFVQLRRQ